MKLNNKYLFIVHINKYSVDGLMVECWDVDGWRGGWPSDNTYPFIYKYYTKLIKDLLFFFD